MSSPFPAALGRVRDVFYAGVEAEAMPGGVICVYVGGMEVLHAAFGTIDGERGVETYTLYDLASLTKPLATAASFVTLLEQGQVLLSDRLDRWLGGVFELPPVLAPLTLHQLLTHTSGLPAWIACYDVGVGLGNAVRAILATPLKAEPGTRYEYSCLNFILLARILREVTGTTLDDFAAAHLFTPLGLASLAFRPGASLNVAPTVSREGLNLDMGPLVGVVHDGNARGIEAGGDVSGNAGLFGTARDVARFGDALLGGTLFGGPARTRVLRSQIAGEIGGHSLLFFAAPNPLNPTGDLLNDSAVGHSGFTGTSLVVDPSLQLSVALLTNSVFLPDTKPGKTGWLRVRRAVMNTLAGAL